MKPNKTIINKTLPVIAAFAALIFCAEAATIDVSLTWDNSVDPNVTGYRLYHGPSSGNYTNSITVGNTNVYRFSTSAADPNTTFYFAVTALTTNNTLALESDFSSEVAFRHPFITSIVKSASQVQLSFTTILGKVYRVKQSSSVPNSINSWTTAGSVNGTGSPVQLTIPNAVSSQLFYLIEQLP